VTLVVDGQAFVSQHIGDLEHFESLQSFQQTIEDLVSMYEIRWDELLVVHDCHPQYASTTHASALASSETRSVQHHRAHVASVLAERGEWNKRVVGICFDGTGYGDDGTIWGGEMFAGSISAGFERVAHLRRAILAGGDAAAHYPIQAAAGFLAQLEQLPDVTAAPFHFSERFQNAMELIRKGVRTFTTTSMGRLFDAAAALLGFIRETSFEGQAAMWLEQKARNAPSVDAYPFPFANNELDFRPLLESSAKDRSIGRDANECARAFQKGVALGVVNAATELCARHDSDTIVLSGGVFQNELLLQDLKSMFSSMPLQIWTNNAVPANDGGISLGQAALASFAQFDDAESLSWKESVSR
jgi:hydrogenase maturation protein HypF